MSEILFYGENVCKIGEISDLCVELSIKFRLLRVEEFMEKIGTLLTAKSDEPKSIRTLPFRIYPEIMILNGFADNGLDIFLKKYRDKGIKPTPLKAMVTPYNIGMTLSELADELQKEHDAMHR